MRLPLLIGRSRGIGYKDTVPDLKSIYFRALDACAPDRLVARVLEPDMLQDVVAIGKCAGALLDGLPEFESAFVAILDGYCLQRRRAVIHIRGRSQTMYPSSAPA